MSSMPTSDPIATFLIGGGTPQIYTGQTDISILVCGTPYFDDLNTELTALGTGDLLYISAWSMDVKFALPSASQAFFQQLATLAQKGVDVRVLLFNPYPASFARNIGDTTLVGAAISRAAKLLPKPTTGATFLGYDWVAAIALRNQTPPSSSAKPLKANVLLDWSGTGGVGVAAQHQKAIVIYSTKASANPSNPRLIAYLGGIDLVSSRISPPTSPTWHDVMLKLTGGAAADALINFAERWTEASQLRPLLGSEFDLATKVLRALIPANDSTQGMPLPPNLSSSPPQIPASSGAQTVAAKAASVQIVRTFPPYRESPPPVSGGGSLSMIPWSSPALSQGLTQIKQCLVNAINQARSYVYVEDQVFFWRKVWADSSLIWGTSVLIPVLATAAARGVKIIILGSGQAEGSTTPTKWDSAKDWLVTELIANSGSAPQISINALSSAFVHAKVVIIDDLFALVGSANFADRSLIGEDIEMSAALVSPALSGSASIITNPDSTLSTGSIIQDLRVNLWAYHFGYGSQLSDPKVWAQLADTTQSFGLWDSKWQTTKASSIPASSASSVINFTNTS